MVNTSSAWTTGDCTASIVCRSYLGKLGMAAWLLDLVTYLMAMVFFMFFSWAFSPLIFDSLLWIFCTSFFLGWFLVVLAVCFRPCPLPWWEGHTWTLHRCSGKLVSSGKFGPAAKVCWRWKSLNGLILILQARRFLKNSRSSWTMQWDTVLAKSPWEGSLLTPLMWHCDYDGACTLNRQMISFLD